MFPMKVLDLEDMKYLESVISEEFGLHALAYNNISKFCEITHPIELPFEQGELFAIGMIANEAEEILMKVKRPNGDIAITKAIEL